VKITPQSIASLDAEALRNLLLKKEKELASKDNLLKIAAMQIKILLMKLLGINLERRPCPDPETLDLFEQAGIPIENSEPPETIATTVQQQSKTRKQRKPEENRQELPADLERVVKVLDLPEENKICPDTGKSLQVLGTVVTEVLEIEAPKFYVMRYERPQYVCPEHPEEGVYAMSLPKRIIPKGIAGESLLAFVLTSKYIDHMPLERISKMLDRSGVAIPRQTMSDWVITSGRVLEPLRLALHKRLLESRIVNADETTYKVLPNHSRGKPIKGYLWGFVGDGKYLLFEWNNGRASSHPIGMLAGSHCKWLQTDAYSGYTPVLKAYPAMQAVGCWAHVRRKFAEAEAIGEIVAKGYLDKISLLYGIEKEIREGALSTDSTVAVRKEKSYPILQSLITQARHDRTKHVPRNPMGKALLYMESHWDSLVAYLKDGDLEIDNNIIERAIRPVALGRKNWLFSGSEVGAQTAALVISLVGCCKLSNIEPSKYLRNVLRILPNYEGNDYAELLPDALAEKLDELDKMR